MPSFFQLTYISTARDGVDGADCQAIQRKSSIYNGLIDVTGLLLFNSRRFVQVLEGREDVVRDLYDRISGDPRHYGLVILGEDHVAERQFGQWAMVFDDGNGDNGQLPEKVDALLDKAGPSTRALFQTSARLYRRQLFLD
ncbi:MAG TPA: BLUF domain-containing protein [Sphingobium sp.]